MLNYSTWSVSPYWSVLHTVSIAHYHELYIKVNQGFVKVMGSLHQ